jgi:hypothetical protein
VKRIIITVGVGLALCLGLAACEDTPKDSAQNSGQQLTEDAFAKQQAAVPYPAAELNDSLERRNLAERLRRTNQPNKIGYVYLLSFSGQPLGYYTIKGKVSNTDSQMTTSDLVVSKCHSSSGCNDVTVPAPGDDGSYGSNEPGIFFFTTENAFVTTNLNYLYADQPLPLNVPLLNKK